MVVAETPETLMETWAATEPSLPMKAEMPAEMPAETTATQAATRAVMVGMPAVTAAIRAETAAIQAETAGIRVAMPAETVAMPVETVATPVEKEPSLEMKAEVETLVVIPAEATKAKKATQPAMPAKHSPIANTAKT